VTTHSSAQANVELNARSAFHPREIQGHSSEEARSKGLAEAMMFNSDPSRKKKADPGRVFWPEQLMEALGELIIHIENDLTSPDLSKPIQ
jgi:hypothetical protein